MLRLQHVQKTFNPGASNERLALRSVDLTISEGEFVAVIGSNGAGKSTLLNVIAGTYFPDAGSIHLGGHDITWMPEHRRAAWIGRIFQDPLMGTAGSMTIEENLAMAAARGRRRRLRVAVNADEREPVSGRTRQAPTRPGRSPRHPGSLPLRRPEAGVGPFDGHPAAAPRYSS